jgi:hypothetical protein
VIDLMSFYYLFLVFVVVFIINFFDCFCWHYFPEAGDILVDYLPQAGGILVDHLPQADDMLVDYLPQAVVYW